MPKNDRAELADRLMDSIEDDSDEVDEQAWADEIARRIEEVRSGKEIPVPWEEVRKQLFKDADGDDR